MSKYFKYPFAYQGDNIPIPDDLQQDGSVSYQQGWSYDYQRKLGTDPLAKPLPRQQTNQLYNDITDNIKQYQEYGFFDFITPTMNDDQPFNYSMGACVRYDMSDTQDGSDVRNFSSRINDNTTNPKENPENWSDLADVDIDFATNEEAQAGTETDKVISPASLASVTATTQRRGLIQIATNDEVINGSNTTKAVTPASFLNAFANKNTSSNGYQILPGGLIVQWGYFIKPSNDQTAFPVTFPIAFPQSCLSVNLTTNLSAPDGSADVFYQSLNVSNTGFSGFLQVTSYGNASNVNGYYWLAIGI